MSEKYILPSNEINEIWDIFKKYRVFIIFITLVSFVLAITYAFWINKPIYRASVLVQIGKKNARLIAPAKEINTKLIQKYEIYTNPDKNLPKISSLDVVKTSNGILRFTALGYEKNKLKDYLTESVGDLIIDQNMSMSDYIEENNESLYKAKSFLMQTNKRLVTLRQTIIENENKISKLSNDDQALINLYMIKSLKDDRLLERTYKRRVAYTNAVKKYKRILLKTITYETHIIDTVTVESKSITPNKSMIIILGVISGLLFSLLLSFFLSIFNFKRD